jgi:hypothetical protein
MTPSAPTTRSLDWSAELADQLDWHWDNQLRPRLEGLTDAEYLWEPVAGCWSLRPRADAVTAMAAGSGDLVLDFAFPAPDPSPVATIAWRLNHVIVGVFGARNASHFGGPPMDYLTFDYPGTATGALEALDAGRSLWSESVRRLDSAALAASCGEAEGPFADLPIAALILHINREVIHHGAEVALLRDLYLRRDELATTTKDLH